MNLFLNNELNELCMGLRNQGNNIRNNQVIVVLSNYFIDESGFWKSYRSWYIAFTLKIHCLIRTLLHECFTKCAHFPLHHFIFLHVHICLFPSPDSISLFNPLYTSTPVLGVNRLVDVSCMKQNKLIV